MIFKNLFNIGYIDLYNLFLLNNIRFNLLLILILNSELNLKIVIFF